MPYRILRTYTRPYLYVWSKFQEPYLPEVYRRKCKEYMEAKDTPVHWIPSKTKYRMKDDEVVEKLQDVPIRVFYPPDVNDGLWGGEGVVLGHVMSKKQPWWFPELWKPKITRQAVYSEILDKWFMLQVSDRALDLIDEHFGLDSYILKTPEWDLKSMLGMKLKKEMITALSQKSLYPNDPVKREKVYNRYKEYLVPEDEIEWMALSVEEAVLKGKELQQSMLRPMKYDFAEELIHTMSKGPDEGGSSKSDFLGKLGMR